MVTRSQPPIRPGAAKRTRRGPFTRQQILDASLRLFSERGFARTTVRDIAAQAGITDAAIYYHFESKRELLQALVEERGFVESLSNLQQVEAEMPVHDMVFWMAAGAANIMDQNRDFLRLIIMEGLGADDAALEQYSRLLDLWERALTTVLARYQAKNEIRADVPVGDLALQIIYTIMMAFQDSLIGRHGLAKPTTEARQEALRDFLGPTLRRLIDGVAQPAQA